MYISLAESSAKGFRRWSDAHPPCGNDNETEVAQLDAVMMPPEGPRDPWLVPGAGNAF